MNLVQDIRYEITKKLQSQKADFAGWLSRKKYPVDSMGKGTLDILG